MDSNTYKTQYKKLVLEARATQIIGHDSVKANKLWKEVIALSEETGYIVDKKLAEAGELESSDPSRAKDIIYSVLEEPNLINKEFAFFLIKSIESNDKNYDESIKYYQKELDDPKNYNPNIALRFMGYSYSEKGDYDKAIEYYQKAIDDPHNSNPSQELYGMGYACINVSDYDEAIAYFQKVLDDTSNDSPYIALRSMGYAYDEKGDYDKAIEFYQKALDDPNNHRPSYVLSPMGFAFSSKGDYDKAIECFQKALDDPKNDTPSDEFNGMGFVYSKKGDDDIAIEYYQKVLDDPKNDTPYLTLGNIGNSYSKKGDYDKAIEYHLKALDHPSNDRPYIDLRSMGNVYSKKGDYDKAIRYYQKSLDDPKNDTLSYDLYWIGYSYNKKGNYDKAIECYQKALDDPKNDTPSDEFNGMGNVYSGKGDYDKAIEYYQKALDDPSNDNPGSVLHNLGSAFNYKGDYDKAIEYYQKALDDPNFKKYGTVYISMGIVFKNKLENDKAIDSYIKAYKFFVEYNDSSNADIIQLQISNLKGKKLSKSDTALLNQQIEKKENVIPKESSKVSSDVSEIISIEKQLANKISEKKEDIYSKYHENKSKEVLEKSKDCRFYILRETSSSVCLVPNVDGNDSRGGGYFFKWNGYGVVIDPGFDFVRNFHEAGFHIKDIDLVLVSHNHPDHNQDLKSIDTLFYEMDKRYPSENYGYTLICDKETSDHVKLDEADYRRKWYCDPSNAYSKTDRTYNHRICNRKNIPIEVCFFEVKHCQSSIGFTIDCFEDIESKDDENIFRIGYTGDSEYSSDLKNHLGNCDLLVANMSQPDSTELNIQQPSDGNWKQKDWHLGYWGTIGIIKEVQAEWNIVGEFWEGLGDARFEMVDAIRQRTGCKHILPADRGLEIDLSNWTGRCVNCDDFKSLDSMKLIRPKKDFDSLHITCTNCIL
ncbi:MAG: tetratricopeptide repeat protein [Spirochaetaceae bacterium]